MYQGTELWDFSLVDPDNRRPVDYALRRDLLASLRQATYLPPLCGELMDNWQDGRVKMWTTMRALELRREHPELFHEGTYLPLEASEMTRHVCAFARVHGKNAGREEMAVVAAPRFTYSLMNGKTAAPLAEVWGGATIAVPEQGPREFENVFTGETVQAEGGSLLCRELFRDFPVALLYGR
jgi:(1->4)-alpha-D-glucan 1-alpha-D-glucosylmutase